MFPSGNSEGSRPRGFHPKPLAEPCGTFACYTAPIVPTATFPGVGLSFARSASFDQFRSRSDQCTYRQSHPLLQFCWLSLLPELLHIPKWRGSKETAVFAGELGAADIANVIRRSRRIHRLGQHEPPSLL